MTAKFNIIYSRTLCLTLFNIFKQLPSKTVLIPGYNWQIQY